MMALGPSSGVIPAVRQIKVSRKESCFSSGIRRDMVNEVVHSLNTSINCLWHLITSEGNDSPTKSGGLSVDWAVKAAVNFFKDAHVGKIQ